MTKKLAVVFPGVGYTADKPLLYYGIRLLQNSGYEIRTITYENLDTDEFLQLIRNTESLSEKLLRQKTMEFVAKAAAICEKQLSNVDFLQYDRVVFLGKSIGTVIANIYALKTKQNPLRILVTPLEQTFQFLPEGESVEAITFSGEADGLASWEKVGAICKQLGIPFTSYGEANHSLETQDVLRNLRTLKDYAERVADFLSEAEQSIYDFSVLQRNQLELSLADYKGKCLLIVNTATGCGYTPQYEQLEALYQKYRADGLEILDFPCNQFANQAPGSSDEIYSFCTSRYQISFPQFAKIHVNGEKELPLYGYLKKKQGFQGFDLQTQDGRFLDRKLRGIDLNYEQSNDIKWNFTKFLVDQTGHVVARYEPSEAFDRMQADIERICKRK